jgi:hypothetical protein
MSIAIRIFSLARVAGRATRRGARWRRFRVRRGAVRPRGGRRLQAAGRERGRTLTVRRGRGGEGRTKIATFDIFNAQQALPGAHVNFVIAQHDRVIDSYSALAALGRVTAQRYDFGEVLYHPEAHYDQLWDKGAGVDTPDGQ